MPFKVTICDFKRNINIFKRQIISMDFHKFWFIATIISLVVFGIVCPIAAIINTPEMMIVTLVVCIIVVIINVIEAINKIRASK